MNIELKRAGPGDLSLLSEWRMRVLKEVFPDTDPDDIPAIRLNNEDYYKKHLSDGSHTACFALDAESGRILGCGGICYQEEMPSPDNLTGQNGYIMNIYTLPEARGEGIEADSRVSDRKTQRPRYEKSISKAPRDRKKSVSQHGIYRHAGLDVSAQVSE
jgi:hypothetical protein